jgi:hypothetical protein
MLAKGAYMLQVDELKTGRGTTTPKIVGRYNVASPGAKYKRMFYLFDDGSYVPHIAGGKDGDDGGDAGDGSGGGDGGGAGTGAKAEFNDLQQAAIDSAFGRMSARHKTDMESASKASAEIIAGLRSDVDVLKGGKNPGAGDGGDKGGKGVHIDSKDWEASQARIKVLEADKVTSRKDKVRTDLKETILNYNVRNAGQIASLLFPSLKIADDGSVQVQSADGVARINTDGTEMSVKGLVESFLSDKGNAHFINASSKGGSGGGGSMFNGDGGGDGIANLKPGDVNSMSDEEFQALRDRGVSIPSSSRPGLNFKFAKKTNRFAEKRMAKYKKAD